MNAIRTYLPALLFAALVVASLLCGHAGGEACEHVSCPLGNEQRRLGDAPGLLLSGVLAAFASVFGRASLLRLSPAGPAAAPSPGSPGSVYLRI